MKDQPANSSLSNRAALYIRLSKEDVGGGESASIGTQRELLTRYAGEHGLSIVDEYVDDGYSGTSFDRPAYRRMVADIERGRVNCVITKDSSRLGRNGAKLLDLLDEYFPLHGIRYISVNDGYDSAALSNGAAAAMPFMAVVNEFYARDISAKIRSSLHTKMENGAYVASFAPYGYRKDAGNKNHLVVDAAAAPVVRGIFRAAAEGRRPSEIAKGLNDRGIATPAEYRRQGLVYRGDDAGHKAWSAAGICKMLRNEVYLGKTLQGKTQRISFKNKQAKAAPREQWYICEGTHEPLIDEETFQMARDRCVARRSPAAGGFENIFSGIARCADCGRTMSTAASRRKGAARSLICGRYKSHGADACSSHTVDYGALYEAVQQELRTLISLTPAERRVIAGGLFTDAQAQQEPSSAEHLLRRMRLEAEKTAAKMKRLYEDLAEGRITAAMYESVAPQYEADMSALKRNIDQAEKALQAPPAEGPTEACAAFLARLDDAAGAVELSRPLLHSLICRIEVEQGVYMRDADGKKRKRQTIRIYYRFPEPAAEEGARP